MQLAPAFVLRNYIPEKHKVVILHKYLGKITCVYTKNAPAIRLCTGMLLFCIVEKQKSWYELVHIDVQSVPTHCSSTDVIFFHEIVLLCLKIVPSNTMVSELYDYLSYVFSNLDQLTDAGRQVVLLRLFLMFDLAPEDKDLYHCALQNPCGSLKHSGQQLAHFVDVCWKRYYQEIK